MARNAKQQAAIAINKKKASKSSAGKYHKLDKNRDGKIDKKDFKLMRAQRKEKKCRY